MGLDDSKFPGERADSPGSQTAAGAAGPDRAPENPDDSTLHAAAKAWFDALPKPVQPVQLAERYPRICNRLAEKWPRDDLIRPYLDDLLMDGRGGRQGFPFSIAIEIASLKEYFLDALEHEKLDVWDRNLGRP